MNKMNLTAVVSLGRSRKEYPYLLNWLYLTAPGMHYLNALLAAQGFKTSVINKVDDNLVADEVVKKLQEVRPSIVLFNQFYSTREEIKTIADSLPTDTIRGVGGQDATFHSMSLSGEEFNRQYGHVDFVWQGECETGFADFLDDFKKCKAPVRVNNLNRRMQDLDRLPVLQHDDYKGEVAFLVTSRGCISNGCDFCTTPQMYPDGWRARSVSHVSEELENIKGTGRVNVNVTDDNFLGHTEKDLERGLGIITSARDLDMKLYPMTSIRQILCAEKKGSLVEFDGTVPKIFLGVENSDPAALRKLGKKVVIEEHAEQCARAIGALYGHGVSPYLGYINFNPYTTCVELKNSADFLHDNHCEASNFHYLFNKLGVYEGSKIFDDYRFHDMEFCINNGEYRFEFLHEDTALVYSILSFVIDRTQLLDFLHFEATHLVYMNRLMGTSVGHRYNSIKKKLNDQNFEFFINAVEVAEKKGMLSDILDLVGDFKSKVNASISEYRLLIPEIVSQSRFILQGPLEYINTIDCG